MATLALVFGILAFVCLGPIGGLLALIFGILGLSRAKQSGGTGRGMSIAGIVLGILNFVVSAVAVVVIVLLAGAASDSLNSAIQNIGGTAPGSSYEIRVSTCSVDEFGFIDFSGEIRNTTNGAKNFLITTTITDSFGVEVPSVPVPVTDIPPGATRMWEAIAVGEPGGTIECRVAGVNNLFN